MAWYVVMSKSTAPREAIRGRENENLAWMKEQHEAGRCLFSGPTTEGVGIWVFRGANKDEVAALLQTHPWVKRRHARRQRDLRVERAAGTGCRPLRGPAASRHGSRAVTRSHLSSAR